MLLSRYGYASETSRKQVRQQFHPKICYTKNGIPHHEPSGLTFRPPVVTVRPGWLLPERMGHVLNPQLPKFQKGDEVVLAKGSYAGTSGVFLQLRADPKWADIRERDSQIRSHPVEWLAHLLRR